MRVLITQSAQDATATAAQLTARGHQVLAVPLVTMERIAAQANLANAQGFLVTSPEGARALADAIGVRTFPAFADSEVTAGELRRLGFSNVHTAKDDAADLARLVERTLKPANGALIYACSTSAPIQLSAILGNMGFAVRPLPLFNVKRVTEMRADLKRALETKAIDAAVFLTADEARAFTALMLQEKMETHVAELPTIAATPVVAAPLRALTLGGVTVPKAGDADSIFGALDTKLIDRVGEERRSREQEAKAETERLRAEEERRREAEERARAEVARVAAEKAAAEEIARAKAEAEQRAKEEAERAAAERKRLEKEQAERERAEKHRIAEEQADRARVKAEAEQRAKEEAERAAAERKRLEKEQAEREQAEKRRVAEEQAAQERAEKTRQAAEKAEQERVERERAAAEKARLAQQRAEAERLAREKAAAERVERERIAQDEAAKQHADNIRRAAEKAEQERLERERLVQERAEQERIKREHAEAARLERERVAAEAAERERVERERRAKEKADFDAAAFAAAERERAEKARIAAERAEHDRLVREKAAAEKAEHDRLEAERAAAAHAEKERIALEQAEQKRIEKECFEAARTEQARIEAESARSERAEKERLAQEQAEQKRLAQEHLLAAKAEQDRIAQEAAERALAEQVRITQERAEAERLERERTAAEKAARERTARETKERARVEKAAADDARAAEKRAAREAAVAEKAARKATLKAEAAGRPTLATRVRTWFTPAPSTPAVAISAANAWGMSLDRGESHAQNTSAPPVAVAEAAPSATMAPPAATPSPSVVVETVVAETIVPQPKEEAVPPNLPHVEATPVSPVPPEPDQDLGDTRDEKKRDAPPLMGGRAARLQAEDAADHVAAGQRFRHYNFSADTPPPDSTASETVYETPPPRRGSSAGRIILWLVALTLIVGGALRLLPHVTSMTTSTPPIETATSTAPPVSTDINARITALEQKTTVAPPAVTALQQQLAQHLADAGQQGGAEAVTSLSTSVAAQAQQLSVQAARIATLEAALGNAAKIDDLSRELKTLEAKSAQANSVLALSDRVTALETTSREAVVAHTTNVALLMALGQWREAVNTGKPFALELETAKAIAVRSGNSAIDDSGYAHFAARGIPTLADLQRDFGPTAAAAVRAGAMPQNASNWSKRILERMLAIITVRRIDGDVAGTDTQAILARAERRLAEGNLAAAANEMGTLTDAPATAAAAWLEAAKARVAIEQSMSNATTRAIAVLAAANDKPVKSE